MSCLATVTIDLNRIRQNAAEIRARTRRRVLAVVKADAYGLGAARVAEALREIVQGYYVFSLREAAEARIFQRTGLETLALEPVPLDDPRAYVEQRVRPSVWSADVAARLRAARPVLSVDTGMHRFAAPPERVDEILKAGEIREAFTHATRLEHVTALEAAAGGRGLTLHAAGTALIDEPRAWLDATRPGLALYRGAVRVAARLVEASDSGRPSGYSGFTVPRHGVILAGYGQGVRTGPCVINGRRSRVLEVGMQSAFVELGPADRAGDEVTLLGDGLSEPEVGVVWNCTPHEALVRLAGVGERTYRG